MTACMLLVHESGCGMAWDWIGLFSMVVGTKDCTGCVQVDVGLQAKTSSVLFAMTLASSAALESLPSPIT